MSHFFYYSFFWLAERDCSLLLRARTRGRVGTILAGNRPSSAKADRVSRRRERFEKKSNRARRALASWERVKVGDLDHVPLFHRRLSDQTDRADALQLLPLI